VTGLVNDERLDFVSLTFVCAWLARFPLANRPQRFSHWTAGVDRREALFGDNFSRPNRREYQHAFFFIFCLLIMIWNKWEIPRRFCLSSLSNRVVSRRYSPPFFYYYPRLARSTRRIDGVAGAGEMESKLSPSPSPVFFSYAFTWNRIVKRESLKGMCPVTVQARNDAACRPLAWLH
jgi:hypothetical protein